MTERHLLFIHTAGDPSAFCKTLKSLGFRLSLIKKQPTITDRVAFDQVVDFDYQQSASGFLEAVEAIHGADPVDGVLSFSESGVIPASIAARHLGLPGNSLQAALRARNKYLMRCAFKRAGLSSPRISLVTSAIDVLVRLRDWGTEAVLKPLSGSSSYGVVRLSPSDSFTKVIEVHSAVEDYIRDYHRLNPAHPFEFWLPDESYGVGSADTFDAESTLLLESFIPGQQVSVDGIVSGASVSCFGVIEIERMKDPRYFLEAESWMPTRFGPEKEQEIQAVAADAARAIGLTCGGFHCELKVSDEEIVVIEIAARRGADNVSDFILQTRGIDVYEEAARLACGEHRVHEAVAARCVMGMRYFLPTSTGMLERIDGLDTARLDPRVSEIVIDYEPGSRVEAPPEGYEFLGYLSVKGRSRKMAARTLDELYHQVRFEVEKEGHTREAEGVA